MISVIVPVYNSEKYIEECIQSVLTQSYNDFELIIVDDGSTDNSYFICKKYAEQDDRVKLIKKKNAGVSSARYEGLKVSQGEYITFLDNDDVWLPDFLKFTIEIMNDETDIVVVSSDSVLSEKIPSYIESLLYINKNDEIVEEYIGSQAAEEIIDFSRYKISKPLWGKLYRKEFLLNLHLEIYANKIPILFLEDVFALNIILINARKVRFSNQILYIQRILSASQSHSGKLSEFYFNQIDSYALLYVYMKKKSVPKILNKCLNDYDKCLQRIWYKLKHENINRKDILQICVRIDSRYNEYYEKFLQIDAGIIRKINMFLFKNYRGIWEYTLGFFYFKIISVYKRRLVFYSLHKQVFTN